VKEAVIGIGSAGARAALDTALLAVHGRGDGTALIGLYTQAAEAADDPVARSFYLTHAYVFALEAGDARAAPLTARLVARGAETDDAP